MTRILFNHGLGNFRPAEQWSHRATIALRKLGHQVSYAQFPNPEQPDAKQWQDLLVAEQFQLIELGDEAGELVFIGHSLGALNFILAAKDGVLEPFDRALLVAPADPTLLTDLPVGHLNLEDPLLVEAVHRLAGKLTIIGSDADHWLPRGIQATFGDPLGVEALVVAGAKHFSTADGWGPWQGVIDWVLDPTADLTVR